MKRILIALQIPLVIFSILLIISCSGNESSKSTVYIDLGLGSGNSSAGQAMTTKGATTTAPDNIESVTLTISGKGMDTITETYSGENIPSGVLTFEIPAGESRFFEVLATTATSTLRGTATKKLSGEEYVYVPILMKLYETKIVVPDYYNNRIVQIDDMNGTNWTTASVTYPYDIDFDSLGRIYIASYSSSNALLYRMDDISSSSISHNVSTSNYCTSIAVDGTNSYIYYSYTNNSTYFVSLGRWTLDNFTTEGNEAISLPAIPDFNSIYGLAINDGILYVSGDYYSGEDQYALIWSYNISTGTWMDYYQSSSINEVAWDVIVKSGSVYAAIYGSENKIIKLNTDLEYQAELTASSSEQTFLGPRRFLAILNPRFYLIDENSSYVNGNRIVSFDSFSDESWGIYDPTSGGYDLFSFYYYC